MGTGGGLGLISWDLGTFPCGKSGRVDGILPLFFLGLARDGGVGWDHQRSPRGGNSSPFPASLLGFGDADGGTAGDSGVSHPKRQEQGKILGKPRLMELIQVGREKIPALSQTLAGHSQGDPAGISIPSGTSLCRVPLAGFYPINPHLDASMECSATEYFHLLIPAESPGGNITLWNISSSITAGP